MFNFNHTILTAHCDAEDDEDDGYWLRWWWLQQWSRWLWSKTAMAIIMGNANEPSINPNFHLLCIFTPNWKKFCPKWKKFFSQWRKFGKSPIKQFTLKSLRLWIRNLRNPPLGWLLILTVNNLFCPQNCNWIHFLQFLQSAAPHRE